VRSCIHISSRVSRQCDLHGSRVIIHDQKLSGDRSITSQFLIMYENYVRKIRPCSELDIGLVAVTALEHIRSAYGLWGCEELLRDMKQQQV
jgi:hypothetical protein